MNNGEARTPRIPEFITVHLGPRDTPAENVTVPFADYIANVASSEIYPTWPENAIRANIYAQTSFALNRIYTEFYRSRGYDFDITNSTSTDQSFVAGREYFENIGELVDELFTSYVVRRGSVEPLFTAYCDGAEISCQGLSQWGTVELANQGLSPYEILQYYYGNDIDIVTNAPVENIEPSAPEIPLRIGSAGDEVRSIQIRLNRISDNYPAIPKIAIPDGVFSFDTEGAVRAFQEIFSLTPDGVIGTATWYRIQLIYNAVKRLNELDSEGIKLSEVTQQYSRELSEGDTGVEVNNVQYLLAYLAQFYNTIPPISVDGVFGSATADAVRAMQRTFDLPVTGTVDLATWDVLYRTYLGFLETIPFKYIEGNILPYPGIPLRLGSESEVVRILQEYINFIASIIPEIPATGTTGYFGEQTQASVEALQAFLGIPVNGTVAAATWDGITNLYSDLYKGARLSEGQYPGYEIS